MLPTEDELAGTFKSSVSALLISCTCREEKLAGLSNSTQFTISLYQDGENESPELTLILSSWSAVWRARYGAHGDLQFQPPLNLKDEKTRLTLPPRLKKIADVRNPDIYFVERSSGTELGGVEITDHSPDGSNVDKRYPYLWISRRAGAHAFVASPYSKERSSGQINRLPFRHSDRNIQFLDEWNPLKDPESTVRQMVPIRDPRLSGRHAPEGLQKLLLDWDELGAFFAHTLAAKILGGEVAASAVRTLDEFRSRLQKLAEACRANASRTDASSLLIEPSNSVPRWIQVYNTRPDSGHWERGEGQFDSIDGRLMFTLDGISFLPQDQQPSVLEFWLPQLTSHHPWVKEQQERGYRVALLYYTRPSHCKIHSLRTVLAWMPCRILCREEATHSRLQRPIGVVLLARKARFEGPRGAARLAVSK